MQPKLRTVRLKTLQASPFVVPPLLATTKTISDFNPCFARLLRDKELPNRVLGDTLATLKLYEKVWLSRYLRRPPWDDFTAYEEFCSQLIDLKLKLELQGRAFEYFPQNETWEQYQRKNHSIRYR